MRNRIIVFTLLLSSVVSTYFISTSTAQQGTQPIVADNEYQVAAILFQQYAAEFRALTYQAFNIARMRIDEDVDKKHLKKLPKSEQKKLRAVVVDIDETVLDNSPHQALLVKRKLPFTAQTWLEWGERRSAKAIPGAVEFLNYASGKGVRVFYVSNRFNTQKQATIDNLKSTGFPDVSEETVLLLTDNSSKEPRRQKILEKYRIVLLIGDNLNDLSDVFENNSVQDRFSATDNAKNLFGSKFIVIPNAMYGAWESAIYENKRLSEAEKIQKRQDALQSY